DLVDHRQIVVAGGRAVVAPSGGVIAGAEHEHAEVHLAPLPRHGASPVCSRHYISGARRSRAVWSAPWYELEADAAVRAVVPTGAGRAFSSGGDQKRSGESPPSFFEGDLGGALIERLNRCILRMQRLRKPVVGSINGVAAGPA